MHARETQPADMSHDDATYSTLEAAKLLGMNNTTLNSKIKVYNIKL